MSARNPGDTLRRFAVLLCGDQHLGEDLVQEVLIKAYRRWPRIELEQPDGYLRTDLASPTTNVSGAVQ
jgi:DNA-directed RNA polymerase specialized sigma24 family protein